MEKLDFHEIESKIQKFWEENKIYSTNLKSKEIYSIDTPPPNISGKMHIGHSFMYSQMDFIARFMRMKIGSVFYPFGTDDNGLPTERLVEKAKKIKSIKMSRADFVKVCLNFLKDYTPEAIKDWKDLGISCDYNLAYSTIDPQAQRVSQKSFLDLYKKGYVYKKNFPTIWCPHCQTSIAQAELEDKEFSTKFSTLKFECEGKDFLIATTRPEMLPACVAVFVNPKDERYKDLIGKKVKVPLLDFEVPIIEDESAQIDKGTGVLMICSYGDRFDLDSINRYKLKAKTIIEKDGTINFGDYSGLKVNDARKKILKDLEVAGMIKKTKEMVHAVNVHDKCGTPIEFVNTPQWFIRVMDKKQELIDQGNKIKWYPKFMHKRYDNWVKGLEWDWSISRNRHFGVPIPAWECEKCKELIFPKEKNLPLDPLQKQMKCKCGEIATPEKMVLDTWATSSVTPQIASDLVKGKLNIPFNLRPQGHDIIRTWAFYTIVKSYLIEEEIPWKDIVITGNISMGGEKMSKSKGNVVDPKKVIEKYCADALRYWAAGSKLGMDLDYQEKDLVTGKKLINKILNATNFVFMNLENYDGKKKPKKLELIDSLFLSKIGMLIEKVTESFMDYEYSKAKQEIDEFFWSDFCDNYLEIVKKRVYQGEGDKKLSAQYTLYNGLLIILKLFAPIVPFITEEVYQKYFKKFEKEKSIHLCSWPVPEFNFKQELNGVYKFDRFVRVLEEIRKEKSNAQKSMNSEIKLFLQKEDFELFNDMLEDLRNVTGAFEIIKGEDFKVEFVSN